MKDSKNNDFICDACISGKQEKELTIIDHENNYHICDVCVMNYARNKAKQKRFEIYGFDPDYPNMN